MPYNLFPYTREQDTAYLNKIMFKNKCTPIVGVKNFEKYMNT